MISDHGIHSRDRILIPVSQPEFVQGKTCYIEVDPYAKREVAVLYLDEDSPKKPSSFNRSKSKNEEKLIRRELLESMKRCLNTDDDATVRYYLSLADGDMKKAYCQYNEDLRWERSGARRGFPCFR